MMSLLRKLGWILLGLVVVAGVVYAFLPRPVAVDVAEVTIGPLQVTVDEDGQTRIRERYIISAPLAGRLLRVKAEPGDRVVANPSTADAVLKNGGTPQSSLFHVVAEIQPTDPALLDERAKSQAEARVQSAEAALKKAKADLERARVAEKFAQKELTRVRPLALNRSLSREEYDRAMQRARMATQELKSAQFAVRVAEYELEQAKSALKRTMPDHPDAQKGLRFPIRSPIDGYVLRVFQESEAVVTPGQRLLEVGDPTDLEVVVDVLTQDAVKIHRGARVLLERWGGDHPLKGEVRLVEPSAFTKISALGVEEQRVNVIIDFTDPLKERAQLQDAYRVEARMITWEGKKVLQVPTGALFRYKEGWAVFCVEDGKAKRREVTVGHRNGLQAEILEGLAEGETVVVHPSDKVKDGVSVEKRE